MIKQQRLLKTIKKNKARTYYNAMKYILNYYDDIERSFDKESGIPVIK